MGEKGGEREKGESDFNRWTWGPKKRKERKGRAEARDVESSPLAQKIDCSWWWDCSTLVIDGGVPVYVARELRISAQSDYRYWRGGKMLAPTTTVLTMELLSSAIATRRGKPRKGIIIKTKKEEKRKPQLHVFAEFGCTFLACSWMLGPNRLLRRRLRAAPTRLADRRAGSRLLSSFGHVGAGNVVQPDLVTGHVPLSSPPLLLLLLLLSEPVMVLLLPISSGLNRGQMGCGAPSK